jgi:PhzF family phenazine biosynthesis protein
MEVDLCGHATLASAFVLFDDKEKNADELKFDTVSGELIVTRDSDLLCLNFPASPPREYPVNPAIGKALGVEPVAVFESIDFLVLVENEETLRRLTPDFSALRKLTSDGSIPGLGIIVTAPGADCDFVSRYFAPEAGVPEDPVTGRAHCTLTPFWSKKLGKKMMDARQLSKRGGVLRCEDCGNRVKINGKAVRYLKGTIYNG